MVTAARQLAFCAGALFIYLWDAKAQDPGSTDITIVTATRFVTAQQGKTARALFEGARVQLSEFNETDHCIDQGALDKATEYFDTLGRELAEAGHYYFVPEDEMKRIAGVCESTVGTPPRAWRLETTQAVAFGRAVPTPMAANLEQKLR